MRRAAGHRAALGLVLALVAVTAVACGGKKSSQPTYTVDEVVAAFADHGFTLAAVDDQTPAAGKETVLAPQNAEQFGVAVTTNAAAADTWKQYVSAGPGAGSLYLKRGNVLLVSDGGLTAAQRRAVQAAVAALPDRGENVEKLEKQ